MANYKEASIPLELVHEVFGHTKSFPQGLLFPEVEKCEFHVLSDGSAEIFFTIRTDYGPKGAVGTERQLPPIGPGYDMELYIPKERVLDCIAHSGVADVEWGTGLGEYVVEHGGVCQKISESPVIALCWEHSRELVLSYICLFQIGGQANQ